MKNLRKHKGMKGSWIKVWMAVMLIWSIAVPAARPVAATGAGFIQQISAGQWYSMVLKTDGTVFAWGNNNNDRSSVPAGLTNVTAIAAGSSFGVALKEDGSIASWGGQGIGPLNIPSGLNDVAAIDAGSWYTLALKKNGTGSCLGRGERSISRPLWDREHPERCE